MNQNLCAIFLLCALSGVALAQGPSHAPNKAGKPNNNWLTDPEGKFPTPLEQDSWTACRGITINYTDGRPPVSVPAPAGVQVTLDYYNTAGSGYHGGHEVIGDGRPNITVTSAITQTTDDTGCVTWNYEWPGFAGYLTLEANWPQFTYPPGTPAAGITRPASPYGENLYAKNLRVDPTTGFSSPFIPYPDNQSINKPQSLHTDQFHPSGVRFLGSDIAANIETASFGYGAEMAGLGIPDLIDLWRASLPDGGINDDSIGTVVGFFDVSWLPAQWTENPVGDEVDIVNPASSMNPLVQEIGPVYMMRAMALQGCYPGKFPPGTIVELPANGRANYWLEQPTIHFACGPAPLGSIHVH